MKTPITLFSAFAALFCWAALAAAQAPGIVGGDFPAMDDAPVPAPPPSAPASASPVVVELFTAQGCPTCPRADAVLAELGQRPDVIIMSWHVEDWNRFGWRDRFSTPAAGDRQTQYNEFLRSAGNYTPQMIVDGSVEFAGASRERAEQEIAAAAQRPKATVSASAEPVEGSNLIRLTVRANNVPAPRTARDGVQVVAYIVENNLETVVTGGANNGQTLVNQGVVRFARMLGAATPGTEFRVMEDIPVQAGWNPRETRIVIVLQERIGRRIVGATEIPLP